MYQQGIYYPGTMGGGGPVAWGDVSGKPEAFPPQLPSYAFAGLPAASGMAGRMVRVTDVGHGGSVWYSDGVRWRSAAPVMTLFSLTFGESGLSVGPGTAETWIGAEIAVPAGVIRPGDIVRDISLVEYTGTLDAGTRTLRTRMAAASPVTTASALLAVSSTSSTTIVSVNADKPNMIASTTMRRSMPNSNFGSGTSSSAPVTATLPGLDEPTVLRPSAQNQSASATMVIYHYVLRLERGGL